MIRNFFSTPNIIGKLVIALLFVGGVFYAGAFDGFVVETQASSCCGGETDTAHFSSSSCCKPNCSPNQPNQNGGKRCDITPAGGGNTYKCKKACGSNNKCNINGCNGYKG